MRCNQFSRTRKALLVYPEFPVSYWSLRHALDFVGRKSLMPPLGLLTVAALFPDDYELKVVDMNVQELSDADLRWADCVFLSAMKIQQPSFDVVVARCRKIGVKTVAGGPYPTSYHEELAQVDHVVRGEVEDCFADFLALLDRGDAPHVYTAPSRPSLDHSPVPRFDLIPIPLYQTMAIQFSRGCPFDCEFCDITALFGRIPRTKPGERMIEEMQTLYDLGWRGSVFFVDDNFIGNKREAGRLILEIARWQEARKRPFAFFTEASVNLAEMDGLMADMVDAGFYMVFLGIETLSAEVLASNNKKQNVKEGQDDYLARAVRKIHRAGMQVTAGFILGMDGDHEDVFDTQIEFIQKAGIPWAMVGLLIALKGTHLYERLQREGRLLQESIGNNVEINFVPEMDRDALERGYLRVLSTLYDPKLENYFERCWTQLQQINPQIHSPSPLGRAEISALVQSLYKQLFSRQGPAYARFLLRVITRRPRFFGEAVKLAICGYHFEKVTSSQCAAHSESRSVADEGREMAFGPSRDSMATRNRRVAL